MTNTMPILTDEQRKELISDLQDVIKEETHSVYGYAARIALAALTATRKGFIEAKSSGTDSFILKGFYLHGISIDDDVYAAPPVPALKLPEESDLDPGALVEPARRVAFMNGARFAIGEVKRMNGVTE